MIETLEFDITKRLTPYPHACLRLTVADSEYAWMIPNEMPAATGQQRIAIGMDHDPLTGESKDMEGDPQDHGACEIEYSNKIKIIIRTHGTETQGRFLIRNPSWGRRTNKKLWVIEKLKD